MAGQRERGERILVRKEMEGDEVELGWGRNVTVVMQQTGPSRHQQEVMR